MRAAVLLLFLAPPLFAQTTAARLDEYLAARTRLGQFSGAVLVAREGTVLLRKGYGYANLEHLVPNTPDSRFEIASLTKAFTAFAVHDLARQEKLRLDEPFCTALEQCPDSWQTITLRQLLHHTSGIPDYENALDTGSAKDYDALMRDDAADAAIERARGRPLDFPPGTKFKYSNTAYLILGLIIERVSGAPYETYLRQRIFTPLGLASTAHIDRTRVQRARAEGYTHQAPLRDLVGGIALTSEHLRRVPHLRQAAPQADGGLLSTIDDLHNWTGVFLGRGGVEAELVRELLTPNEPGRYAAGWFVSKRFDRDRIHHNGVLPGMVSQIDIFPQSETVVIVLCNLDRARLSNIARDLALITFGMPYDVPRPHRVSTIDAGQAAEFLGRYKLSDGRLMTIGHDPKNGWLEAAVKDQFIAGLLPEGDAVFYAPMWEGTITFTDGALVMRQTGVDIRGERVSRLP